MNLLITGSLGHIGSKLIYEINKINFKRIFLVDSNLNNNLNVIFGLKNKKIKFFLEDINNFNFKKKIKKLNYVIHLASMTNAENSLNKTKEYFNNNYNCFKRIVKICNYYNSKLIHISSTSVYGVSSNIVDESLKKKFLRPQSPYAKIKLLEENFLKKQKVNFITLRFGTIVGPSKGMRFHTAANKFCLNSVIEKEIPIWKTAYDQYRPYLSLNDAVNIIKFILKKDLFDNEIYNVVTNNLTVKNLIVIIKKYLKKKIKIKFVFSKIMNQLTYKVSSNKIKKKGFKFKGNIDRDIKDTLNLLKI